MPTPVLIFDWGDTLMRVFPDQSGPMAAWERVEALPGVQDALRALRAQYRLVIATNAGDSTATQVRQALARVDLAGYFEAVLTSTELGTRKPDPAFYTAISSLLHTAPTDLTMLGDSYPSDILAARQAGLRTVWYNPAHAAAPALLPLQDVEFNDFTTLPGRLASPPPPGYDLCHTWLLEQNVPANLWLHVHCVAAIAYRIAVWVAAQRHPVSPLLVHRGGLLHDLAKANRDPRWKHLRHPELAALILRDKGQPILAEIASRHGLFSLNSPNPPRTLEERIVYFADKLAEGSRLVDFETRLQALSRRYPADAEKILAMSAPLHDLQDELAQFCAIPAATFYKTLRQAVTGY